VPSVSPSPVPPMMPIMKTSVVLFVEEHSLHRPARRCKRDAGCLHKYRRKTRRLCASNCGTEVMR
jgi:hypothetical protein